MTAFHAWMADSTAGLHVWRLPQAAQAAQLAFDRFPTGQDRHGLQLFQAELDHQIHEPVGFKLFAGNPKRWEHNAHNRFLPRLAEYRFPEDVWFVHGVRRVVTTDPFAAGHDRVRIHVITADKYRGGQLFVWLPGRPGRYVMGSGEEPEGVFFDVVLTDVERRLLAFKAVRQNGDFEDDSSNRLWTSADGDEVWTHADTDAVVSSPPQRVPVTVRLRQSVGLEEPPTLHLWGLASDFVADVAATREATGVWSFTTPPLYTGHDYHFRFFNSAITEEHRRWEHPEAERRVTIQPGGPSEYWTLEGDHELYAAEPAADCALSLSVVDRPAWCQLSEPLRLDVWVNRARGFLHRGVIAEGDGRFHVTTYPEVVTSFRFRSAADGERLDRHTFKANNAAPATDLFVSLERPDPLVRRPTAPLFGDPPGPTWIARPGAWAHDGHVRFAVHAPTAARVEIIGEWTDWRTRPVHMQCTHDGSYWWGEVAQSDIRGGAFHGALYKFLLNDVHESQDPAADWVESSNPQHASKLVDHGRHVWRSTSWQPPGTEYLVVYQLHPRRFTSRFVEDGRTGLDRVAEEIRRPDGYLRTLGVTAILLMPVNEFAGDDSWGYNPAFFYAVETAYGGPDALKRFVDVCHAHGIAVLLDVVFNHAGTADNALWSVARDSFFKGDTTWGALVNFAHPQVIHFFEQNLRALIRHYRVDGFRFDHTWTIRYSDRLGAFVTRPGSSGGWEFMHKMRRAVHAENQRLLLTAEHLPNEWDLTNFGGPMDSQWCDDFHDRLEDACKGQHVMSQLAEALQLTHTVSDDWYKATNYPESHDEVGNENDRIAQVGGFGRGLRRNKVAAAVTLLSRGIPMWFMGAESGEHRQFLFNRNDTLDLDHYMRDQQAQQVRRWWRALIELHRGNSAIQGPSPLSVLYAADQIIAFARGSGNDYVLVANFGEWNGWRALGELNLPDARYRERLNSTWGDFRVEHEDEHANRGEINRTSWLHLPDYGAVILERQ